MNKIFFLLNSLADFDFGPLLTKHLPGVAIAVGDRLPDDTAAYDLIVPWNYRKKIPIAGRNNIVVFHGSDLPSGRGWAPIYYSFAEQHTHYTLSAVLIDEGIDTGEILAKASFALRDNYTAPAVRRWDAELSLMLTREILARATPGKPLRGAAQQGEATYHARRRPADNEVSMTEPIHALLPHLRGCEDAHPAFFLYNGTRYAIRVEPVDPPAFPNDIQIELFLDGIHTVVDGNHVLISE